MGKRNNIKKNANSTAKPSFAKSMKSKGKQQGNAYKKKGEMKVTFQSPVKTFVGEKAPQGMKVQQNNKEGKNKFKRDEKVKKGKSSPTIVASPPKQKEKVKTAPMKEQVPTISAPANVPLSKSALKKLKKKAAESEAKTVVTISSMEVEAPSATKEAATDVSSASLNSDEQLIKEHNSRLEEYNQRCAFIKPVPNTAVPKMLKGLSSEIVAVRLPVAKHGKVKGFAFLEFKNKAQADSQKISLSGKSLAGRPLQALNATYPKAKSAKDIDFCRIYVAGLSSDVRVNHLETIFLRNKSIEMAMTKDGGCSGTAAVSYNSKEEAVKAFKTASGKALCGKNIVVSFSKTTEPRDPKEMNGLRTSPATGKGDVSADAGSRKRTRVDTSSDDDEVEAKLPSAKKSKADLAPLRESPTKKAKLAAAKAQKSEQAALNASQDADESDDEAESEVSLDSDVLAQLQEDSSDDISGEEGSDAGSSVDDDDLGKLLEESDDESESD